MIKYFENITLIAMAGMWGIAFAKEEYMLAILIAVVAYSFTTDYFFGGEEDGTDID